jgi:hypothetical protein
MRNHPSIFFASSYPKKTLICCHFSTPKTSPADKTSAGKKPQLMARADHLLVAPLILEVLGLSE